jgi:hypothetical protein
MAQMQTLMDPMTALGLAMETISAKYCLLLLVSHGINHYPLILFYYYYAGPNDMFSWVRDSLMFTPCILPFHNVEMPIHSTSAAPGDIHTIECHSPFLANPT